VVCDAVDVGLPDDIQVGFGMCKVFCAYLWRVLGAYGAMFTCGELTAHEEFLHLISGTLFGLGGSPGDRLSRVSDTYVR